MKKVVLIETTSSQWNVYSRVAVPRLGCILLGTILKNLGYQVKVLIEDFAPIDPAVIKWADVVGISTITATAPRSYRLAQQLQGTGKIVILGGSHVTFLPDEALQYADYVVRGEGEEIIVELLEALQSGGGLSTILGLSYRQNGEVHHNPSRPLVKDLDRYPIPDYDLIHPPRERQAVISVMTTRGCPYNCSFCSVTAFNGRAFRASSVGRVLEEVRQQISRWNPRYLFLADDIFNWKKKRMLEIIRGFAEIRRMPRWGAQVRHELSHDGELLDFMARTNCDRVFVGFESINPRTLERYNKRETVEDIIRAMKAFHTHRVKVHGMFVLGSDDDTVETVRATRDFALKHNIDSVQFLTLTPLPGARDFQPFSSGERSLITDDWELFDGHHVVHQPAKITAYELQVESAMAMRKFYAFRRIVKYLLRRDWIGVWFGFDGWRIVRAWFKANKGHLQKMREQEAFNVQPLTALIARTKRPVSVAIPTEDFSPQIREVILTFFSELGVRVVEAKQSFQGILSESQDWLAEGREQAIRAVCEHLEPWRDKVDAVALPRIDVLEQLWERLTGEVGEISHGLRWRISQLPKVIQLPGEPLTPAFQQTLTRIGLVFTDDLAKIRIAIKKAMRIEVSKAVS